MKKLAIILVLLTLSLSAFAKNVELKIKTKHQIGEKVQVRESVVVAKLGKTWDVSLQQAKLFKMKMNVTDKFEMKKEEMQSIDKAAKVFKMSGKIYSLENGKEELVSSPTLIVENNKEAVFKTVQEKNGVKETFEMTIIPTAKL